MITTIFAHPDGIAAGEVYKWDDGVYGCRGVDHAMVYAMAREIERLRDDAKRSDEQALRQAKEHRDCIAELVVCHRETESSLADARSEIERMRDLLPPNRQPTELTRQLRLAVSDQASEYDYEWRDKPHRLVYRACEQIELQAVEIERMRAVNAELVTALELAQGQCEYPEVESRLESALARAKEQPQ